MARINAKLCQNEFQTIPSVSFFLMLKKIFFHKKTELAIMFFATRVYGQTDVKIIFLGKFSFR